MRKNVLIFGWDCVAVVVAVVVVGLGNFVFLLCRQLCLFIGVLFRWHLQAFRQAAGTFKPGQFIGSQCAD